MAIVNVSWNGLFIYNRKVLNFIALFDESRKGYNIILLIVIKI